MLHFKHIFSSDKYAGIHVFFPNVFINQHIFDFEEERTVERAIFDDNIELLQQILVVHHDEGKYQIFNIESFFPYNIHFRRQRANRIEVAAMFGSIKCFKYLLMNGDEINEDTCKFCVAGGNLEIIHLCEQQGLQFEDCLFIFSLYHRFAIFK